MRVWKAKTAYWNQASTATARGIKWELTFRQWVDWWEAQLGPNWQEKRGRHKGQYVMARFGDRGPYALWNIYCTTCGGNAADKALNGTAPSGDENGNAKLTAAQAINIYKERGKLVDIAKKYGVTWWCVKNIKRRNTWQKVTANLGRPGAYILTDEEVLAIFKANGTHKKIAEKFGVSRSYVGLIKQGIKKGGVTTSLL